MDETTNTRPSPPRGPGIAGSVALLLLATFWVATVFGTGAQPAEPRRRLELRLRRLFETNAPGIRTLALPTNVMLHAFGERRGSERVVVARSRLQGPVLFLSDELDFERAQPWTRPLYAKSVASIRARMSELRARGVARIVLVPVPTKFAVLAEADPSVSADACAAVSSKGAASAAGPIASCDGAVTARAYRELAASLAGEPAVVIAALHDPFVAETRAGRTLYAFEDTHWTSYAMTLAARDALRAWRGGAPLEPVRSGSIPDHPGDLHRMLALPDRPSLRTHPLEDERYELPAATTPCQGAVFHLGSSYSRYAEGLAAVLQRGSGCTVVDLAEGGRDADASFGPLYAKHGHELAGAVVIWEFPFRQPALPRRLRALRRSTASPSAVPAPFTVSRSAVTRPRSVPLTVTPPAGAVTLPWNDAPPFTVSPPDATLTDSQRRVRGVAGDAVHDHAPIRRSGRPGRRRAARAPPFSVSACRL